MKQPKVLSMVLLLLLAAVAIFYFQKKKAGTQTTPKQEQRDPNHQPTTDPSVNPNREGGLNRRVAHLIYTKHAKCRMQCRHIDASEVQEILEKGEINLKKSELQDSRGPEYAVEGTTHNQQRVRIIFAQDPEGTAVVTVIDLDNEWQCDCK